ncbi:Kynurenine formamidase [Hydrobacter penzbergensis]|uniref:Kynurenine formamidase n=1 Tax=Hydrobacter penzbergensis TaxID=1235997 RepID=A0A8X8IC86_9BACT|nr:cyclase family protein [Hydrobacter penzbergensis]SDW85837.1 Kynurenine formamidase [Hydrobacter penzbergensis]
MIHLSYFLSSMTPAYGGEENAVKTEMIRSIAKGDNTNNLLISFPAHIGTHVDFPFHFSNSGKTCSDYTASFWIFQKIGIIESSVEDVPKEIEKLSEDIELLIWKTGFSKYRGENRFWMEQPVVPANYAKLFRDRFRQLRVFGFDMISLTSKLDRLEGRLAHQQFLLEHEILVLEDMKLDQLNFTPKTVIIAPLLVEHADGAPCHVIAW